MVTMDHGGTSGGLDNDCRRMDYLQVAWLLREKLNALVDGDKGEYTGLGLQNLLDMTTSRNIVSMDPKMLNLVLWRTLPKELLLLVLARLPLPDITRLLCLSKEWKKDMATMNSEINQACHKVSSTRVALLSLKNKGYFVTIYDFKKCKWQYAYHFQLRSNDSEQWPYKWIAMGACDGGLVCFISLWKSIEGNRLSIVVMNLLTRAERELPPLHYVYFGLPAMVKIKVDSHTRCYQVVVVDYRGGGLTIEIYDSNTRQWTTKATPSCGPIFDHVHKLQISTNGWVYRLSSITPGAYDFTKGKLELYSENNPSTGESVIDSVLEEDRMFVLQKHMQMNTFHQRRVHWGCCIIEYHFEKQTKAWVQGKTYECPSFKEFIVEELFPLHLIACDGFLMVHYNWINQYYWLLDLSTSKWSNVRNLPETSKHWEYTTRSLLCRAFWNVIP